MIYIGIDPGKKGAICIKRGLDMKVFNMPDTRQELFLLFKYVKDVADNKKEGVFALCEKVGSMPGNSGKSMFTFGQMYERVLSCLTCNEIPFDLVIPNKWQGAMGIAKRGKDESKSSHKKKMLQKAQDLFPALKIGRLDNADAVLICEYASRSFKDAYEQ